MNPRQTLLLLTLLTACHEAPELNGVSLTCNRDEQCRELGDEWRCLEAVCVRNAPPELDGLFDVTATEVELDLDRYHPYLTPNTLTLEARFTDADDDNLTITWSAAGGQAVATMPSPVTGARAQVTLAALGVYSFDVAADDGYGGVTRVTLHLVAQSTLSAIYVSQGGSDGADCGTVNLPCATIDHGLDRAAAEGATELLLAAASGASPYQTCLDLSGSAVITGCFDPVTWEEDPALRGGCRIECDTDTGHTVRGSAQLRGVTLALAQDVSLAAVGERSDGLEPLTTVWARPVGQESVTPTLEDVEILAPACGPECRSVGLGSYLASPTLTRVDVRVDVAGFDPLGSFIGMVFLGGAPVVTGASVNGEITSGIIEINAPTNGTAVGVAAVSSAATLSTVRVHGGPANNLGGVSAVDSPLWIGDSAIELEGFGTFVEIGVYHSRCQDSYLGLCESIDWLPAGAYTGPAATPPAGDLEIDATTIALTSASPVLGAAPCLGAGLVVTSFDRGTILQDSTLTIGANFTAAFGAEVLDSGLDPTPLPRPQHLLANNTISIADARIDFLCFAENAARLELGDYSAASSGAMVWGAHDVTVRDNRIQVGANESISSGVLSLFSARTSIEGNTIAAAESTDGVTAFAAAGATLLPNVTGDPSRFVRNALRVGNASASGGAIFGVGLQLLHDAGTDPPLYPRWEIANNTIHGGRVPYSTGASFKLAAGDPEAETAWPVVRSNTIHGGGDSESGFISTALATTMAEDTGWLENNLLDAGDSSGRKILADNQGAGFFTGGNGNVAQHAGYSLGPQPLVAAFLPSIDAPGAGNDGTAGPGWFVLDAATADVLRIEEDKTGRALLEREATIIGARVLAGWFGAANPTPFFAVVLDGRVAIAAVTPQGIEEFNNVPLGEYDADGPGPVVAVPHQACAAIMGDVDRSVPADLVFISGPSRCHLSSSSAAGAPGVWSMTGRRPSEGGGFAEPRILLDLSDPVALAASAVKNWIYAGEGTVVHLLQPSADASTPGNSSADAGLEIRRILTGVLNGGATEPYVEDVVLTSDTQVTVWRTGVFTPILAPCPSGIVAAAIGDIAQLPAGDELAVACTNGDLIVYEIRSPMGNLQLSPTATLLAAGAGIATLAAGNRPSGAGGGLLVGNVVCPGAGSGNCINVLIRWSYNSTSGSWDAVPATPAVVDPAALLALPANPVIRDLATGQWLPAFPDVAGRPAATLVGPGDTAALCPLEYRHGGATDDLGLTSAAGHACENGGMAADQSTLGLAAYVTDDIDGCDARTAAATGIDVGADEIGSDGQTCD